MKEILSILQRYYGVSLVKGAAKAKVVKALVTEIARDPTMLPTSAPAQLLSEAVGMNEEVETEMCAQAGVNVVDTRET